METTVQPSTDAYRQAFKHINKFMLFLWRLGFRRWINAWPSVFGQIMVLGHTGRVSGLHRHTPVNYAIVDGELYCTVGFGHLSDWYRNILANPNIEVRLPDGWWAGIAKDISDHENRTSLLREALIASGFAAPLFGVNPQTMGDRELAEETQDYLLIHIRLTQPLSGPGGPGDLAWVWVPVVGVVAIISLLKKYAKRNTR